MKNEYWILCGDKNQSQLVIDIYDEDYMQLSREERFSQLKNLLLNEVMEVRSVAIQWECNGYLLNFEPSWVAIARIVRIHELLEEAYTWLFPLQERNIVLENGSLVLDESKDNRHLSHYKKQIQQKGK